MNESSVNTNQPTINMQGQYIKDIRFARELPKDMALENQTNPQPKIDVTVNLDVIELSKDQYEVDIKLIVASSIEKYKMFSLDLNYSANVHLTNVTSEQKDQILLIHCPALIFPFARRVISDVTRDGGFMPLMLDPIDFAALYHQRKEGGNNQQDSKIIEGQVH